MVELELSIQQEYPESDATLRSLLAQFEAEHRVQVKVRVLTWGEAWHELVKVALYHDGPDVSQVGNTWVSSLVGMNALSPITARNLRLMGGAEAFLPELWSTSLASGVTSVWSIPWLAYARLIYYRKDWLKKTGVDEQSAFATPENFHETLRRLAQIPVPIPWSVPVLSSLDSLHNIAAWIWQAGGELISRDGKHIMWNEPAALAGIQAYFELLHYVGQIAQEPNFEPLPITSGKVAVAVGGPGTWMYELSALEGVSPEVPANIHLAVPLGVPFIGASNLVIWNHSRQYDQAAELVRFLSSHTVQSGYNAKIGLLPTRLDVLNEPPFTTDPQYQVMNQALKTGRTFPTISLWGLIEDRLPDALGFIGQEVVKNPGRPVDDVIKEHLTPLTLRLQTTLSQQQ